MRAKIAYIEVVEAIKKWCLDPEILGLGNTDINVVGANDGESTRMTVKFAHSPGFVVNPSHLSQMLNKPRSLARWILLCGAEERQRKPQQHLLIPFANGMEAVFSDFHRTIENASHFVFRVEIRESFKDRITKIKIKRDPVWE